jgi:hypothetical protein
MVQPYLKRKMKMREAQRQTNLLFKKINQQSNKNSIANRPIMMQDCFPI